MSTEASQENKVILLDEPENVNSSTKENIKPEDSKDVAGDLMEIKTAIPKGQQSPKGETKKSSDAQDCYGKALQIAETDGSLVKGVKLSFMSVINRLLNIWKCSLFVKCFPQLASNNQLYLEKMRTAILKPIEKALFEDVSYIITENLQQPLATLSGLRKQSRTPHKAWRPTGDPRTDMITRDVNVLQYEKHKLEKTLEQYRGRSEKLQLSIMKGRREAERNNIKLLEHRKMLDEVQEACHRIPANQIMKANISLHENSISKGTKLKKLHKDQCSKRSTELP